MPPTTFIPSLPQRRLRDALLDHPELARVGDLCRHARVPRRTYSYWSQNPAFCAWLSTEIHSLLIADGWHLIQQARARAPESFRHWKFLFDLTFDPRGLQSLFTASTASRGAAALGPAPMSVPASPEQNQALTSPHCPKLKNHRRSTPLQSLRLLRRARALPRSEKYQPSEINNLRLQFSYFQRGAKMLA